MVSGPSYGFENGSYGDTLFLYIPGFIDPRGVGVVFC